MSVYGIVNKKNIRPLVGENTTKSRYMVVNRNTPTAIDWSPNNLPVKRKLSSREAARAYKRSLNNPQNWSIVDLANGTVVR